MSNTNYSRTITVAASAEDAYKALTQGFEYWWTKPDEPITKVNGKATFTFPPGEGHWTFQATDLKPGQYVEMVCIDALHLHEGMPKAIEKEWLDTKIIWHIKETGRQSEIHFEHRGLTPDLHCYDVCREGWDYFFVDSLKAYLDTGVGTPHVGKSR